jgi:hypothetical protein
MTAPLSQELQSPLDEVLVELEHAAVPGVGIAEELAVGSRRWRSTVFLVGTILSLSPFITSTGCECSPGRWASADPIGGWP